MKKVTLLLLVITLLTGLFTTNCVYAQGDRVEEILASMSNENKIAQMLMPAFRKKANVAINYDNIREILSSYGFAGVILFAENTLDTESTMRFIDLLQTANKDNASRLFIAIDQEGGYINRLSIGTNMPGNMALTATNNPDYAYNAAKIIGKELKAMGINVDFAPVVDVNNNPANPVIGIRSFSDEPYTVATYSRKFMQGLQSEGIITSLKHFPGHGDTESDTHTGLSIINKSYDELKNNELIPFQELINSDTDMIMTAHIQFPNIETETYVSKNDGETYTLPATLSKTILTDILRNDMGYDGVIVTDSLAMSSIGQNFGLMDASIKAINAGADILLIPFEYDSDIDNYRTYIETLANKIGTEIDEDNVNNSVRRILKLKEKKGLLEGYDNSDLEEDIIYAKNIVSSKENHNEELKIAKKAITMVKNDGKVLPLNGEDKTVILYEFSSHIQAVSNAINMLKNDGSIENGDNISVYPFYNNSGVLQLEEIKEIVKDAKNVILLNSLYNASDLKDPNLNKINELIDYIHGNNGKVVFMSTQLPYDIAKFTKADAIVITYLANGIRFDLNDYEKEVPKYGPNVIAGIYMLFTKNENMSGVLPVNIYDLDSENNYTNQIIFQRGFGLKYIEDANLNELDKEINQVKEIINSNKDYTEESLNNLIEIYSKVLKYQEDNPNPLEDKQDEIDNLVLELQKAKDNLKIKYKIFEDNKLEYEYGKDLSIRANGDLEDLIMLKVDGIELSASNYVLKSGSTIAILKASYLNTLNIGNHTLTFVYKDGDVDVAFMIPAHTNEQITNNPKTGDNIMFYIFLLGLSINGFLCTVIYIEIFKKSVI